MANTLTIQMHKFKSCFIIIVLLIFAFTKAHPQANNALSNLVTTAINQSLLPGTDNSKNLGSSSQSWKDIYLDGAIYLDGQKFLANGSAGGTFVGNQAGNSNTGANNTFIGYQSGYSNTSGDYNTANGYVSLTANTTGHSNAALGYKALNSNNSGYENTGTGTNALRLNTVGHNNTAHGYGALYSNTIGGYNTAAGHNALHDNISDDYNTAFGSFAGDLSTNSDWSSFFGYYAGCSFASAGMDHSTAIGYNSKVTGPDQVKIGNSSTGSIGGYADWTDFSDGRYKKEVKEDVRGLEFINKLRPVTYHLDVSGLRTKLNESNSGDDGVSPDDQKSIEKKEAVVYSGFIAQEVEKAAQEIGYDFSGVDIPENENSLYGLRYGQFVVPLVKAVQELSENNEVKDVQISNLQNRMGELEVRNSKLEGQLAEFLSSNPGLNDGAAKISVSDEDVTPLLGQNIPNPFDHSTVIPFRIPKGCSSASIVISESATGRIVTAIPVSCNETHAMIEAGSLASGTYTYLLYVDGKIIDSKRMELIK